MRRQRGKRHHPRQLQPAREPRTFRSGIDGVLTTLHGEQGSDLYEIGLAGEISAHQCIRPVAR